MATETTTQANASKKKMGIGKKILIGIGILFVIGIIGSSLDKTDKGKTAESPASTSSEKKTSDNNTTNTPSNDGTWTYSEDIDQMDNSKRTVASLTADNTIEFEFPYKNSEFTINIRKWKGSTDVYLHCSSCQFIAGLSGEKSYRVKFDEEQPFKVEANHTTSGSADIVFLGSVQKLISKIKTGKKLIIEPEFFEAGYKPVTFSIAGLKW